MTGESILVYPKDKPEAIEKAIKLYGSKAKNGVIVLYKGKLKFEN